MDCRRPGLSVAHAQTPSGDSATSSSGSYPFVGVVSNASHKHTTTQYFLEKPYDIRRFIRSSISHRTTVCEDRTRIRHVSLNSSANIYVNESNQRIPTDNNGYQRIPTDGRLEPARLSTESRISWRNAALYSTRDKSRLFTHTFSLDLRLN